jgi:Na+/melibiose symporter-like transporter
MYAMMTPMIGEIIDYDEACSGQRREALYNGLSGFVWKASMGGSVFIATQSMNYFGNSPENALGVLLVGPIAGLFGLLGMIAIVFYPVLNVVQKEHENAPAEVPQDV